MANDILDCIKEKAGWAGGWGRCSLPSLQHWWGHTERIVTVQPGEDSGGSHLCVLKGRVQWGQSQALSSGVHWQDRRQWAQTETQVSSEHQGALFNCEGDCALAGGGLPMSQRGGGPTLLGDTKKPSGHGPGQLELRGPAWARGLSMGLDQMNFSNPFQPQPFCEGNSCHLISQFPLVILLLISFRHSLRQNCCTQEILILMLSPHTKEKNEILLLRTG